MGCNKYDNRDDRLTEISSVFSKTESVRQVRLPPFLIVPNTTLVLISCTLDSRLMMALQQR